MNDPVAPAEPTATAVDLVPLTLGRLPTAVWISLRTFQREWPLVSLTYVWHLLRTYGLPGGFSMVRRRRYWLGFERRIVGGLDIVSTRIHEPDIRWVMFDGTNRIPKERFAAFLLELMPECRLALVQTSGQGGWSDGSDWVKHEGRLPASDDEFNQVYSVRRGLLGTRSGKGFWVVPRQSRRPSIHTEFYLLSRAGRAIGLTGLYEAEWWPHVGWGGWGSILREYAQRRTALAALAATEHLARQRRHTWFCAETSGSPEYRSARWLYEHCGLKPLLIVDNFFRNSCGLAEERCYMIYGKKITGFGTPASPLPQNSSRIDG